MASIELRNASFCVRWQAGRGGRRQCCTFRGPLLDMALAAKTLAESRHHRITSSEVYAALNLSMIVAPPPPSTTPTLREWIERWLALKIDVAASTHAEYARLLRHRVIGDLGDLYVDQISRFDHLDPWKASLSKDLAAASVHKHWAVLSTVMRDAVPHYRPDNPLDRPLGHRGNGLPRLTPYRAYFLTTEEAQILQDACPEQIRPLIQAALGTGMRLGELLGLRVGSVHLDGAAPTVRVEQTLQGDGSFAEPKTEASRRSIRLPDIVAELFAELVRRRRRSDLVFAAPRHGPWNANNLRQRCWYPALAAAQRCPEHPPAGRAGRAETSTCDCATYLYQRPRFHDLRHSHVAFLIDADWDFYAIQRRLGHASIKTTFDVYGHLLSYGDEQQLSKLELRLPKMAASSRGMISTGRRPIDRAG